MVLLYNGTSLSTPSIVVLPGLNNTSFVCSFPCISFETAGFAVGETPKICGVYVVLTFVPFSSSAWTSTGSTVPVYVLSVGVKITLLVPGVIL